ncbi:hypothetical protein NPIL_76251 [Nephila pilipes]|uniref:Uncharacterized protein n=1 Tax=Nephila pilipes TaxID=299642 RepID=A0A8X6TFV0_NEPPI|nr:hypothetical protein NPIL_76251 [Nephila pilipes]
MNRICEILRGKVSETSAVREANTINARYLLQVLAASPRINDVPSAPHGNNPQGVLRLIGIQELFQLFADHSTYSEGLNEKFLRLLH